jgi:hypothetical protein
LYYLGGISLFAIPLCAGDKKNEEERKERFEDQVVRI